VGPEDGFPMAGLTQGVWEQDPLPQEAEGVAGGGVGAYLEGFPLHSG